MAHPSFQPVLKELIATPKAQSEKFTLGRSGQAGGPQMTYLWMRAKTGLVLNGSHSRAAARPPSSDPGHSDV